IAPRTLLAIATRTLVARLAAAAAATLALARSAARPLTAARWSLLAATTGRSLLAATARTRTGSAWQALGNGAGNRECRALAVRPARTGTAESARRLTILPVRTVAAATGSLLMLSGSPLLGTSILTRALALTLAAAFAWRALPLAAGGSGAHAGAREHAGHF